MLRNQSFHSYHYILEVNHNTKCVTVDNTSSYHIANSQSPLFVKLWAPGYVIIILAILKFGVLFRLMLLLQITIFDLFNKAELNGPRIFEIGQWEDKSLPAFYVWSHDTHVTCHVISYQLAIATARGLAQRFEHSAAYTHIQHDHESNIA